MPKANSVHFLTSLTPYVHVWQLVCVTCMSVLWPQASRLYFSAPCSSFTVLWGEMVEHCGWGSGWSLKLVMPANDCSLCSQCIALSSTRALLKWTGARMNGRQLWVRPCSSSASPLSFWSGRSALVSREETRLCAWNGSGEKPQQHKSQHSFVFRFPGVGWGGGGGAFP